MRGSGAYRGEYATAVAGYRVGPDYIEAHRTFVAVGADEHGGRVLGFYSLVLAPPELDLLFVADEAQGRGIGRSLVAHMRSEASAAGLDRVKVVSHRPAEDFYHRVGAVRTGTALANPPAVLGLPAGVVILCFGGFMMFIGFMMIRKIVDIEV